MQLADIGTKNVRDGELNNRLEYTMVILDNWYNTCTRGVIGYRRIWRAICSDELTGLSLYGLDFIVLKCWRKHWKLFWKKTVLKKIWN